MNKIMRFTLSLFFLFLSSAIATSEPAKNAAGNGEAGGTENYKATQVFKDDDIIWGFDFLSETEILISEKNGALKLVDLKKGTATAIAGGPKPIVKGQGGLMDVKIHRANGKTWVYLTSAAAPEKGDERSRKSRQTTALYRTEWAQPALKNLTRIFEAEPSVDSGFHFGSRLAFPKTDAEKDGGLFISIGERNERNRAQDLTQHWGKVLHLTLDGKAFPSNPFRGDAKIDGQTPRTEIYSYGQRNPQGLALHPETGDLFESEHGPRGGDEINLIEAGKNYGWPLITYGREYSGPKIGATAKAGLEQPLKYYVPSIAPSSLIIYSGKKYSEFKNAFIQGALVLQHLNIVTTELDSKAKGAARYKFGPELRLFGGMNQRIRNVGESPSGEIYFSTDSGLIFRVDRK